MFRKDDCFFFRLFLLYNFTRNNLYNIVLATFVNVRKNNRSNRRSAALRDRFRPASRIASHTPPTRPRSRVWRSLENRWNPERRFNATMFHINIQLAKSLFFLFSVSCSFKKIIIIIKNCTLSSIKSECKRVV